MIKRCLIIYKFTMLSLLAGAQEMSIDSLVQELGGTQNDTIRLVRLITIARMYAELSPDSSFHYAERSLVLARKLNLRLDEGSALREMGYAYLNRGNYPRSLQTVLTALAIQEDPESEKKVLVGKFPGDDALYYRTATPHLQRLSEIAFSYQILGILYANMNNYERSWHYHLLARQYAAKSGNIPVLGIIDLTMNRVYLNLKKKDSALISIQHAYDGLLRSGYKRYLGSVFLNMGRTYAAMGDTMRANEYYRRSLEASREQGYFRGFVASSLLLAEYYTGSGKRDSAFHFIMDALSAAQNLDAPDLLLRAYTAMTRHYHALGNSDSLVKYQALIIKINDSLFNAKQAQQFQNIDVDEQLRRQQVEEAQKALRAKWRTYSLIAGFAIILAIAILLWRNSRQRKKANLLLSKQKDELEKALSNLKATQNQLVQSEKMASLGELTAGIAHEIQNPLNFVNNFADVNKELIEELKTEKSKLKNDRDDQLENQLLSDIEHNLEKINHHGKRAEEIVKGMLLHSRGSGGQKELTDINALCDEYLRLAYHGLRAKDKFFNASTKTKFDNNAGKLNVIPQDIGRVILNLINNAFYAVAERQKQDPVGYEPSVIISTAKQNSRLEIKVKDNGSGIPQKISAKIFQPFFTTKPAGQGTGLGLSLSYDIIKAHGGDIHVESKEGEGTAFTVILPA